MESGLSRDLYADVPERGRLRAAPFFQFEWSSFEVSEADLVEIDLSDLSDGTTEIIWGQTLSQPGRAGYVGAELRGTTVHTPPQACSTNCLASCRCVSVQTIARDSCSRL